MRADISANETVAFRLRQAVERLHVEIECVEFWATALDQLARPIPDYDSSTRQLNAINLAQASPHEPRA
jgi:hypothetical protein